MSSTPMTGSAELTVGEAARRAGVSVDWLRKLCDRGELPSRRFGPNWRLIPIEAIDDYVRQREVRRNRARKVVP